MKSKLTFIEKWFLFWGFPYLINIKTGEVHFLPKKTAQCGISNMARHNKRYLSRRTYNSLQGKDVDGKTVNGCMWCNKKNDLE